MGDVGAMDCRPSRSSWKEQDRLPAKGERVRKREREREREREGFRELGRARAGRREGARERWLPARGGD